MLGATSQNALDLPLEYASVFAHIDNNGTRGGGSKVTDDNEPLDEKLEILPEVTTPLYIALFIIVLVNVALHRFCPMSFKKADVLFAGDHFIDDSVSDCCVRCVSFAAVKNNILTPHMFFVPPHTARETNVGHASGCLPHHDRPLYHSHALFVRLWCCQHPGKQSVGP